MATGTITKFMNGIDTGWHDLTPSGYTGGPLKVRKNGDFFMIRNTSYLKLTENLANGEYRQIATLPSEFQGVITVGYGYNDSNTTMFLVKIQSDRVELRNTSGQTITPSHNLLIFGINLYT